MNWFGFQFSHICWVNDFSSICSQLPKLCCCMSPHSIVLVGLGFKNIFFIVAYWGFWKEVTLMHCSTSEFTWNPEMYGLLNVTVYGLILEPKTHYSNSYLSQSTFSLPKYLKLWVVVGFQYIYPRRTVTRRTSWNKEKLIGKMMRIYFRRTYNPMTLVGKIFLCSRFLYSINNIIGLYQSITGISTILLTSLDRERKMP